jgi:hypothetical protein
MELSLLEHFHLGGRQYFDFLKENVYDSEWRKPFSLRLVQV